MTSLRVLAVASEIYPIIKTGGLADVVGALPAALKAHGVETRTLVPGYPDVLEAFPATEQLLHLQNFCGGPARVLGGSYDKLDLLVLDAPHLFARPGNPYVTPAGADWPDNGLRFAALAVGHGGRVGTIENLQRVLGTDACPGADSRCDFSTISRVWRSSEPNEPQYLHHLRADVHEGNAGPQDHHRCNHHVRRSCEATPACRSRSRRMPSRACSTHSRRMRERDIWAHEGILNKTIGDAVMAVFNFSWCATSTRGTLCAPHATFSKTGANVARRLLQPWDRHRHSLRRTNFGERPYPFQQRFTGARPDPTSGFWGEQGGSIRCGPTTGRRGGLYAFDLIEQDGDELRDLPLIERKRPLAKLLDSAKRAVARDGRTAFPKDWSLRNMPPALSMRERAKLRHSRMRPPLLM